MSGVVVSEGFVDDALPIPVGAVETGSQKLSEHWCTWCRTAHGFGYCAHASWLTRHLLARRGAHFNWR